MGSRDRAWFVYVARCADGTLYTGIAIDVEERIAAHDAGTGAKYTRGRGPLTLRARARCNAMGDAMRVERAFKALPRAKKLVIAASPRRLSAFAKGVCARARAER